MNWQECTEKTDSIPWLKEHRDWVEQNEWGYGDRPLHYMWYKLLEKLPIGASLMEIGVYKGQTVSLWQLIGQHLKKNFRVMGVTPLTTTTDKYHTHEDANYKQAITQICEQFKVPLPFLNVGYSEDPEVIKRAKQWTLNDLDLLYIDGGHDEETVRSDIEHYTPFLNEKGVVVFDDASCSLPDFGHWYKGLEDVSRVVDEFAQREDYEEFLIVGHNRCFRKLA